MPLTAETIQQLQNLSPEQRISLREALVAQQAQSQDKEKKKIIQKGIINGLSAFGEGALLGFQNRPLSEGVITGAKPDQFAALLKEEQLKNAIDPSRRLSALSEKEKQMQLDYELKKQREMSDIGSSQDLIQPQTDVATTKTETVLPTEKNLTGNKEIELLLGPRPKDLMIVREPNNHGTFDEKVMKNSAAEEWDKKAQKLFDLGLKKQEEKNKTQVESQKTAIESTVDLNKFAGAAQGLSQAYADMISQGSGGNRVNLTKGRVKSWIGGSVGEQASNLRRVDAAHRDLVLMMAPILSKSGRVLVSILKMLGETYPSGTESAYTAKNMIQQDVLNMYRITKAANSIDPKSFEGLNADQADGIAQKIISRANSYQFSPEEEKALTNKMSEITAPLEQFISPEKQGMTILKTSTKNDPEYERYLKAIGAK